MKKKPLLILLGIIAIVFGFWWFSRVTPLTSGEASLPAQFNVSVFRQLKSPRVIAIDPLGRLVVSDTTSGEVVLLFDNDKDGVAEEEKVLLSDLDKPHGLVFHKNTDGKLYLYVAETGIISRYEYDISTTSLGTRTGVLNIPADGRHVTRTIAFGPKLRTQNLLSNSSIGQEKGDRLYVSVGSSCDACQEETFKRASILESDEHGTYVAQYARGLRNSVFFDFNPITREIWATEMGRDGLGDLLPPDEINIVRFNQDYGWPLCYGDKVLDVKYSPTPKVTPTDRAMAQINPCDNTVSPHIELPAHSAPLGMAFIPVTQNGVVSVWPKEWQGNLLVALHGSTQSGEKIGYKIVRYVLDKKGNVIRSEDFMTGFLQGDTVKGRPVDIKILPSGIVYVSDDYSGNIYQITYKP